MGGFNNPVVGALKLIRRAIQSPNYAAGSTGWTINDDGTAEFNDLTIRGKIIVQSTDEGVFVYSGAPAAGNLIVALASADGTDAYGNAYTRGLYIAGYVDGDFLPSAVTLQPKNVDSTNFAPAELFVRTVPGGECDFYIASPYDQNTGLDPASILLRGQDPSTPQPYIYMSAGTIQAGGVFIANNMVYGKTAITPSAANTPTSKTISGLAVYGSTFIGYASVETTVAGTTVTGWATTSPTASSVVCWVTRTNTTNTTVCYQLIGQ